MDILLKETMDMVVKSRFPKMNYEDRLRIEELLIRKTYKKGACLLNEGEISKNILFIGKGMIRQYYYKNKKDITEHFSYEGCIAMCIESVFKQEPSHLIVEAIEDSICYYLPYNSFMELTKKSWGVNLFYRKIIEYSLIASQIKADSWRFETAQRRYELLMEEHPEVIKRAALSQIASYLLMTPETLSRVRATI